MSQQTLKPTVTKIGGYEILEKIGHGASGTVYKGKDALTGKVLAIKVVSGTVANHPVARLRFAQECKIARKLDHPHMVRVFDYGLDGNKPYLVMEYVDGESLRARIERKGRLPEAEAVRLIGQVGQALHWAHRRKIIHRDVKPDNVLLTRDGKAKLSDLGVVKDLDSDEALTQGATCLGTPQFMAPEQFRDARSVGPVSDVYALAATLYVAVTGEMPFTSRSARALVTIFKKKVANDLTPPRVLVPELSERVESAILRAMRADQKQRPASVLAFLESLATPATVTGPAAEAEDKAAKKERRNKTRFASKRVTSCRALQRVLDESWEGRVVDISETGVCLELGRRFETGALLSLVVEGENRQRRAVVVRVRWVKPKGPKNWQMGCQLDHSLCDFEVSELR
jgi:serine/threonine protein kinase